MVLPRRCERGPAGQPDSLKNYRGASRRAIPGGVALAGMGPTLESGVSGDGDVELARLVILKDTIMATQPQSRLTPEEYLACKKITSPARHAPVQRHLCSGSTGHLRHHRLNSRPGQPVARY